MLRYESPVARQPRVVKDNVELGGKRLLKGHVAFQTLNAANRDPAWFDNPDTFNIERRSNKHLAFGMGIHFCLGAGLARIETQEVFKAIIERLPGIRLVSEKPVWDRHKPIPVCSRHSRLCFRSRICLLSRIRFDSLALSKSHESEAHGFSHSEEWPERVRCFS